MEAFKAFFAGKLFEPRHKTLIHGMQAALIIVIIALAGARMVIKPSKVPSSRSDMMAISMGVKSIIVLLYQILTEHVKALKKWGSLKAYAILNTLEIVFWSAVVVLVIQGNTRFCQGTSCALSWVVVILSGVLIILSLWESVISNANYRHFKAHSVPRGTLPRKSHRNSRRASHHAKPQPDISESSSFSMQENVR